MYPWAETVASVPPSAQWTQLRCATSGRVYYKNEAAYGVCVFDPPGQGPPLHRAAAPPSQAQVAQEAKKVEGEIQGLLAKNQIAFQGGQWNLIQSSLTIVEQIADKLKPLPSVVVKIHGHAACSDVNLSLNRVKTVETKLRELGCQNSFETKGWADKHPQVGSKMAVTFELLA